MRLLIALLCYFVCGPLFLLDCAQAAKKQVVFIRYPIETSYFSTVISGFKDIMTNRGYVEEEHVEYVDILTSTADEHSIPEVLDAVAKWRNTADIFITFGWVSMSAREVLKDSGIPHLFVPVLRSVATSMLPSVMSNYEKYGFAAKMVKPFQVQDLQDMLATALGLNHMCLSKIIEEDFYVWRKKDARTI